MNTTQTWNAIYTRSNYEKKICKLLTKKGVANYFPENLLVTGTGNQQKQALTPLFPSLIFIQQTGNKPLSWFKQLSNVTNLVYWQQQPAIFPGEEIDLLRNFLETHETVQTTKTRLYISGDTSARHTDLHSFSQDNIHTIHLPSIGYSLAAKANPVTNIKLVRKNAPLYKVTNNLAFILGFKANSNKV